MAPVEFADDLQPADALLQHLFPPHVDRSDPKRRGTRTDGILVLHRGAVIVEAYGGGWGPEDRHLAWSVTKSFTHALAGVAVQRQLLRPDASVCRYLSVPADRCAITVDHLLTFSSGLAWNEVYEEGTSPTESSVLAMLYGDGRADMATFVAGHAPAAPAGTTYRYSSGDTNLLMAAVRHALLPAFGVHYPWTALLDPLGIDATWEVDPQLNYIGSSYLYASPRDLARFGQFALQDGCWDGQQLLPEGWMARSTEVNDAVRANDLDGGDGPVQGRHWWLNRVVPEAGRRELPWPSAPPDTFAALGHWKQSITVIPSEDLVVVRTADDRDGTYDHDRTLALVLDLARARP